MSCAFALSGTWAGTIVAQISTDGGTTWSNVSIFNYANSAIVASATANGQYALLGLHGTTNVRIAFSAYTSGTVSVNISATQQSAPIIQFSNPDNVAIPPRTAYMGGNKAGNVVGVLIDANGNLQVAPQEQAITKVTGQATANGATTVIAAVAGKVIKIYKIWLQNVNATAEAVTVAITQGGGTVTVATMTLLQYQMYSDNIKAAQKYVACDTNTAVVINLTGASNVNYCIDYAQV